MKTTFRFLAIAAALFSVLSCTRELENTDKEETPQSLHYVHFIADAPETKTNLDISQDGEVFYSWTASDVVDWKGEGNCRWTIYKGEESASAIKTELDEGKLLITAGFNSIAAGDKIVALYNRSVSSSQTYSATSKYHEESDVMISNEFIVPEEFDSMTRYLFSFKREVAFVRPTLKGLENMTSVKSVLVESSNMNLTGDYDYNSREFSQSGSNTIFLDFGEVAPIIENGQTSFYFASMPVDGANLKMTVYALDNESVSHTFQKTLNRAISFTKGDVRAFNISQFNEIVKGEIWEYIFTTNIFKSLNTDTELTTDSDSAARIWRLDGDAAHYLNGSDPKKGQQFGSSNSAFKWFTLYSDNYGESYGISNILVNASTASGASAELSVSVGGVPLKCDGKVSVQLSTYSTDYEFISDDILTGKIEISLSQTTEKALYVKKISLNHMPECPTPVASPEPGELLGGSRITLTTIDGASIYYTTDGADPDTTKDLYDSEKGIIMPLDGDLLIKAIAVKNGFKNSPVSEYSYNLPQCATPSVEIVNGTVQMSCATDGATIRYEIGGETVESPTESSTEYSDSNKPSIALGQTVKVRAFKSGYAASVEVTKQYLLRDIIDNNATKTNLEGNNTSTWITDFTITGTSGAKYLIHSMGVGSTGRALTWNTNGYLYMTENSAGNVVKKITISANSSKKYSIYASTSPYSAKATGTAIKEVTTDSNGNAEYEFSNSEYTFIAINSGTNANYVNSITIDWESPAICTGIKVGTNPDKTVYHAGESFDKTGLVVIASFEGKPDKDVTEECVIDTTNPLSEGQNSVLITYKDKTTACPIEVRKQWELHKIEVNTLPTKMSYLVGDKFVPDGLTLNATYNDGVEDEIRLVENGFSVAPESFAESGENISVTITYEGETVVLSGIVVKAVKPFGISTDAVNIPKEEYYGNVFSINTADDVQWTISLSSGDSSVITFDESGTGSKDVYVMISENTGAERTFVLLVETEDECVINKSYQVKIIQDGGDETGGVKTYQHVFNAKPSTGNNITLSGVKWNISATNLNGYNSQNYAGVQFGSKDSNGQITLTSPSAWSYEKDGVTVTKIKEVRLWLNLGGTSVTPSVTIGGKAATSDGTTVTKNSSAVKDWTKTTKVTFTPAADGNTGVIVIDVKSVKAGYICAVEIDAE